MSLESSGGWERHGCEQAAFSAGSLLKQGLRAFPTPPGWVSEQSEVQVVQPAERAGLSPGGRRSSTKSSGSHKGMQLTRQSQSSEEGAPGEGWLDELSTPGLASSSNRLAPQRDFSGFKKPGLRVEPASDRTGINLGRTKFRMITMKN